MPQAIVDPDEIRRFAYRLRLFHQQLQQQMTALHAQLRELGSSWRDQEHQKFVEEFEQALGALQRFVQAAEQHVPFLLRKADRADEYLQQR
jgi:WXG100 family type VII secretion target